MKVGYLGLDNKARKVRKIYVGVNGKARRCTKAYVGINGVARLIYPVELFDIPSATGSFTYDGQAHSAAISNCDEDAVNVTGVRTAINAGTYSLVFSLASDYYKWSDGTSAEKTTTWSIAKRTVVIPTVTGSYTYDGTVKTAEITGLDSSYVNVSGVTSTKKAGTYTVKFTLKNPSSCKWTDGTNTTKTATWIIEAASVAVPVLSGTYHYTGNMQNVVISTYDQDVITVSGVTSAMDVGTYTVYFSLAENYQWMDGTTSQKSQTWTITRNQPYFRVSGTSSLDIGTVGHTGTITAELKAQDGNTLNEDISVSIDAPVDYSYVQNGGIVTVTVTGGSPSGSWGDYDVRFNFSFSQTNNYNATNGAWVMNLYWRE